ncbi:MAG: hypothetical protein CMI90_01245 [Pelagibacteraceae bacterium]|nr:hypothetical protein [Pelagibacteraceae bacterium]
MLSKLDLDYLRSVQNLSLKHLGLTKSNPSVACLIVDFTKDSKGKVISFGLTNIDGNPHAELTALKKIKKNNKNKNLTAYVSLEPCYKENLNSCSKLLHQYNIKRIVIDSLDPNNFIYRKGFLFLKYQNHKVVLNNKNSKFKEINKFFYINKLKSRPYITLKLALSKNGYSKDKNKKNITSKSTQNYMHHLRLKHDAIAVGYNTLITDNPKLTCRLQGINKKLKKIVFVKKKISNKTNNTNLINTIHVSDTNNLKDNLFRQLSILNINSLLIEGGISTFKLFLKYKIFDEVYLTLSKKIIHNVNSKYRFNFRLIKNLKEISNNFYGKDQIIVYKNTDV